MSHATRVLLSTVLPALTALPPTLLSALLRTPHTPWPASLASLLCKVGTCFRAPARPVLRIALSATSPGRAVATPTSASWALCSSRASPTVQCVSRVVLNAWPPTPRPASAAGSSVTWTPTDSARAVPTAATPALLPLFAPAATTTSCWQTVFATPARSSPALSSTPAWSAVLASTVTTWSTTPASSTLPATAHQPAPVVPSGSIFPVGSVSTAPCRPTARPAPLPQPIPALFATRATS